MNSPGFLTNIARFIFSLIDSFAYWILSGVYNVFYAVSSAQIFSGDVIYHFYGRIQLILGIFMIFKLSLTILEIIMNPDIIKDKQKGAGKIFMRVGISLVMLTLIVPLNIPAENAPDGSLNKRMKDHGILFGTLYAFQDSVIKDNILGKLILGSNADTTVDDNGINPNINNLADVGGTMAATVAKAFIRPTLKGDVDEKNIPSDEASAEENVSCYSIVVASNYYDPNMDASNLINNINETCDDNGEVYAFNYTILGGAICAIIMILIILGFTVDIAVRTVKLAVLRLVAPIPIISYISPTAEKDGAFGNWVKSLTSTYLDLFIRLGIIYFGAYMIQLVSQSFGSNNGIDIFQTNTSWTTSLLAGVFIIVGILFFMKQAPQFLREMLGIKGKPMSNIGLSGVLGGAAMAIGGGGASGFALGMMQGATTAADATAQGKAFTPFQSWAQHRDQMAKIRTGDKDARGGIIGGAMDAALYSTRERRASRLGIGKEDLAKSNYTKDLRQQELDDATRAFELAEVAYQTMPSISDIDMNEYKDARGRWRGAFAERDYTTRVNAINQERENIKEAYLRAKRAKEEAEVKYAKADKSASTIENRRAQIMQVAPRIVDEYRATNRSNVEVRTNDRGEAVDIYGNVVTDPNNFVYDPKLGASSRVDDDIPMPPPHP